MKKGGGEGEMEWLWFYGFLVFDTVKLGLSRLTSESSPRSFCLSVSDTLSGDRT